LSGNIISEYTYFGDRRTARRDVSSGNVYYIFTDRLGSYRTLTDSSGNVKGESDYYPFGAERVISSTTTDSFRFAGMEWDSEDGLNHTLYRQYTPAQCRWETPDPKRGCVSFPQGQNLYAYVKDNPTNAADSQGDQQCTGGFESSGDPCTCCAEDPRFYLDNSDLCCLECGMCEMPAPPQLPPPLVCNCYVLVYTEQVLGCYYKRGCSDGTTQYHSWFCSPIRQFAFDLCPKEATYINGILTSPADPCGPYIKPPQPPEPHGPEPPHFPLPPPPPFPPREPIPVVP
jgi:RHS repeat-associated protein